MTISVRMLGVDPAFRNIGFALAEVDLQTKLMTPLEIGLVSTEKGKNKTVRVSSDNLRRARELHEELRRWEAKAKVAVAEIPSGAQSAKAAYGFGVAVGLVAGHTIPLIEVSPAEAKKAATGYASASKSDMIDWATEQWPDLPWISGRGQFAPYSEKCEHMADALAIIYAGVKTSQFASMAAVLEMQS